MNQSDVKISRRRFLEWGAAGVAIAAWARAGASEIAGPAEPSAPPVRKSGYRLFSEGRIAGLRLKNRLVRSATAEGAAPDGRINGEGLSIYEQLARGGVGLIITGHMVAAAHGDAHPSQTHLDDDRYLEAARSVAATVHREAGDCRVVAQLSHAGPNAQVDPIAPSEVGARRDGKVPRVLSVAEIEDLITQFAAAIARAQRAGFDGVEIHGAHGFLLNAFLSPATNKRDDDYGGSPARRAAIVAKIVASARREVGADYPILIKVSCNDEGEDDAGRAGFAELVRELENAGVDAIDISGQSPTRLKIDAPRKEAYFLPFAAAAHAKVPVILTGGHRSVEKMEAILQLGNVQFVSLARPLLREPDLPGRFREGTAVAAACLSCNRCLRDLGRALTRCRQLDLAATG